MLPNYPSHQSTLQQINGAFISPSVNNNPSYGGGSIKPVGQSAQPQSVTTQSAPQTTIPMKISPLHTQTGQIHQPQAIQYQQNATQGGNFYGGPSLVQNNSSLVQNNTHLQNNALNNALNLQIPPQNIQNVQNTQSNLQPKVNQVQQSQNNNNNNNMINAQSFLPSPVGINSSNNNPNNNNNNNQKVFFPRNTPQQSAPQYTQYQQNHQLPQNYQNNPQQGQNSTQNSHFSQIGQQQQQQQQQSVQNNPSGNGNGIVNLNPSPIQANSSVVSTYQNGQNGQNAQNAQNTTNSTQNNNLKINLNKNSPSLNNFQQQNGISGQFQQNLTQNLNLSQNMSQIQFLPQISPRNLPPSTQPHQQTNLQTVLSNHHVQNGSLLTSTFHPNNQNLTQNGPHIRQIAPNGAINPLGSVSGLGNGTVGNNQLVGNGLTHLNHHNQSQSGPNGHQIQGIHNSIFIPGFDKQGSVGVSGAIGQNLPLNNVLEQNNLNGLTPPLHQQGSVGIGLQNQNHNNNQPIFPQNLPNLQNNSQNISHPPALPYPPMKPYPAQSQGSGHLQPNNTQFNNAVAFNGITGANNCQNLQNNNNIQNISPNLQQSNTQLTLQNSPNPQKQPQTHHSPNQANKNLPAPSTFPPNFTTSQYLPPPPTSSPTQYPAYQSPSYPTQPTTIPRQSKPPIPPPLPPQPPLGAPPSANSRRSARLASERPRPTGTETGLTVYTPPKRYIPPSHIVGPYTTYTVTSTRRGGRKGNQQRAEEAAAAAAAANVTASTALQGLSQGDNGAESFDGDSLVQLEVTGVEGYQGISVPSSRHIEESAGGQFFNEGDNNEQNNFQNNQQHNFQNVQNNIKDLTTVDKNQNNNYVPIRTPSASNTNDDVDDINHKTNPKRLRAEGNDEIDVQHVDKKPYRTGGKLSSSPGLIYSSDSTSSDTTFA